MHRTALTSVGTLGIAITVCLPASAKGQELRRDSAWNGVVTGAALGAGVGVAVAQTTEDICSLPACASLLAVGGAALGHLTDGRIGDRAPVVPRQWVDDSKINGALIGAGVTSAVLLIDLARSCGTGPGQVKCTGGGTVAKLSRGALFGAAVGALVDAAIPKRAAAAGSNRATSRRLSVAFNVRF